MQIQQFQKGKVLGEMKTTFFSPPQKLSTVSINLKIETTKNFRSIYFSDDFSAIFLRLENRADAFSVVLVILEYAAKQQKLVKNIF